MSSNFKSALNSLRNTNAIVTGGSRGTSRSAVLNLAILGTNVAIISSQSDNASKNVQ